MNAAKAQEVVDKIVGQVFGVENPLSLDEFLDKFAFDLRLPRQVLDTKTNETTWAQSTNPTKFLKFPSVIPGMEQKELLPKVPVSGLQDVLGAWSKVNYVYTEKQVSSSNVARSDNVYSSENVYRSQDVLRSKNVVFSDGAWDCEYVAANQRSNTSTFCIRLDDSKECSNSFGISWSEKITNSYFLHACGDVQDSMFCTNIDNKRFCIANMQFEEAEYNKIKQEVIRWILTG